MIIQSDALTVLRRMDDECIHMAVTSSPYYGLRSYGTEPIVWDDGWKGELGQEPTPEMFVRHLTTIFHELKRVLRKDGIFWMNIGDSYSGSHGNGYKQSLQKTNGAYSSNENYDLAKQNNRNDGSCKPKDLIGIPWALAFSMRADGWYLRSDIPWIKRNSLPSSVTDRPSSSIEHVFLFSKSGDRQFWSHPNFDGVRTQPRPDYRWKDKQEETILLKEPLNWTTEIRYNNGEIVYKNGNPELRYTRFNLWDGHDYYYDHIATMQKSSESYNKDKRPRGVIRQKVNENTKYDRNDPQYAKYETIADELVAPVPKQDGTGNETYTGFNARYEPNGLGLRYMRDSDFFFKTWQGLLHNEDGEPMALVVNPKGYKGAHFACVDSETECLTIGGWKRYDQIKEGTPIFTYNMKKACLEIQPIKSIFSYRYSGNLISVFGRSSNMLMTPNHRCVVTTRDKKIKNGRHPAKIVEASNLKDGMKFIVSSHLDFNPIIPNDPKEYYELLGWILSEGHFTDNGGIGISQSVSKNPQKCKRIQYLLEFLKIDFNTWQRKRIYKNTTSEEQEWKISGEYRKKIRHMIPNKYMIPEHFIMLPDEYIESFISGFVGGDGHIRPDGRITISQKSKQPLDIIQAMFLRTNRSCILSQRGGGMWSAFITHNKKDRCFKNSTSSLIHDNYSYDGIVWCPSVENGTFVARRGGRPFITGNSFPVRLVEPLILAGTSDKGVCPKCGAPWVRITKKGKFINQSWGGEHVKGQEAVGGVGDTSCLKTGGTCETITVDWKPTCTCNLDPVPATVIDPFSGSSATGVACKLHNRTYIGIELNPNYVKLGEQRVKEGK